MALSCPTIEVKHIQVSRFNSNMNMANLFTHLSLDSDKSDVVPTALTKPTKKRHRRHNRAKRRAQQEQKSALDACLSDVTTATLSSSEDSSLDGGDSSRPRRPAHSPAGKPSGHRKEGTRGGKTPELTAEEKARYVAMDCEMVGVGHDGLTSAVARVTLVNWEGQVLLDQYIRPDRPVTDYRTYVSGIEPQQLDACTQATDLATCRAQILQLLQDKVLVGHALKNDLKVLGISHPWQLTRDTAKYEPFMKIRFDDGVLWPRKLRELCQEFIQVEIQQPGEPHSSYQDAWAAMELYKAVRAKWEKVMHYKIQKTRQIMQQEQQERLQWPALA